MSNIADHPLYDTWGNMKQRCYNPRATQYADYGGRGIRVCERWHSFHAFLEDMGERPEGHTLERKDNDRDYGPDNCLWATRSQQQRNRRNNHFVTIEGRRYKTVELAAIAGRSVQGIKERVKLGLSYSEVIDPARRISPNFADAQQAAWAKGRAKTHCKHGHEFTPGNTAIRPDGRRACRACNRDKSARFWRRKHPAPSAE